LIKRIAVLYNTRAGKGRACTLAKWLEKKLVHLQYSFESFGDDWPAHLGEYTDVWIVGGDGTLNYFINKYPDCILPLFIFKGGTGNDFAWKLYGKKDLKGCLGTALNSSPRKVDAGICNGKYFVNGVGIGFDGEIVRSIHREKFFLKGHMAYYAAVIRNIFFFREKELEVKTNQISWKDRSFMLTIANGSRYGGGFLVAPQASIDDGLFDIILIPRISFLQRINLLPGAGKGKHLRVAQTTRSAQVLVQANTILAAHYDGEAMEANKFELSISPGRFQFRY